VSSKEAENNNWETMCALAKAAIHPQVAVSAMHLVFLFLVTPF